MAPLCGRIINVFCFNSRSYYGGIVQLQSAVYDDYNNGSGKVKHVPHFRAHNLIEDQNFLWLFIIRYPARPRRIILNYNFVIYNSLVLMP